MTSLLFKLVYTVLLLGVGWVTVRELYLVWLDPRVYIGQFDVVSETGKDAEQSEMFPKRVVAAQTMLGQQLADYQKRNAGDGPSDTTYAISGAVPLLLPPEVLGGMDITVQDINLRQILTAVRRSFLAPNEVRGHVTERAGSVMAAVDWPRAPASADVTKFLAPSKASTQEVAAYIACSVSWARAASHDKSFAAYSRAQFCDFAAALGDLYALEGTASTAAGLDEEQTKLVRRRTAALRAHYGAPAVFPDIHRLRADLLDLLPEEGRRPEELVEAQEDRLRYAMLSPALSELPEEERRMAALALARPAVVLEGGRPTDAAANWAGLLNRHAAEISAAAAATGIVVRSDGTPMASGFIVARPYDDRGLRAEPRAQPAGKCGGAAGRRIEVVSWRKRGGLRRRPQNRKDSLRRCVGEVEHRACRTPQSRSDSEPTDIHNGNVAGAERDCGPLCLCHRLSVPGSENARGIHAASAG